MAESCTPRSFSGGNVMGTRMMQLKMPYSLRMFQNGLLLRSEADVGLAEGTAGTCPDRMERRGGRISTELASADRSAGPA